ncbi:unnamed protein product [Schistocephalus solidus]|uniref:GOLD domain-containing protein n=2 Tax=Schistocephalus solidus TaxID=70667 RepID=A0A183T7I7_SCHSO|nr:unnamed protein product [Schistocephalus solidus]
MRLFDGTIFPSLFLVICIDLSSALYFHIKDTDSKCFLEEIPEDTLVAGKYKVALLQKQEFVQSNAIGIHVTVQDPESNILMSRVYAAEGRFTFTSQMPGDHKICLSSNSSSWSTKKEILRVSLELAVGDHALNYKEIATKEKLNDIQLRVRQLLDQVSMLSKDQDFQRVREEYFRRLSESIYNRVTWWSIAQILLLIFTGIFQMRNLRSFFLAKKLV